MAEPARSPRSRHGTRPVTFADAPAPPSAHELFARRMQDLPRLPSRAALLALTEHDLPNIDDLPSPDSTLQDEVTYYTVLALQRALRHHQGVYVGGCTLVYDIGRPGEDGWISPVWIVPDAVVAFGVGSHGRSSYAMWQEGKPPEFVMEFASVSTWKRDRDEKPARYESLGVSEYFLYDPVGGLLEPRLQGHVLSEGRYRALRPQRLPNGERGLRSEVLSLWAYLQGPHEALRWYDPATGRDLEDHDEVHDAREAEAAARKAAEAELAEVAAAREAAEAELAEAAAAREAAEAELAELRAQVRRLRRESGT